MRAFSAVHPGHGLCVQLYDAYRFSWQLHCFAKGRQLTKGSNIKTAPWISDIGNFLLGLAGRPLQDLVPVTVEL
jgi:hypothetical protein